MSNLIFLQDSIRSYSFAEVESCSTNAAAWFLRQGVQPGDRVGIVAHNSIEYVVAILGAHKAGLSVVPLNLRLNPKDWEKNLSRARAKLVLLGDEFTAKLNCLPTFLLQEPFQFQGSVSLPKLLLEREAFVLFTSGSSADPKAASLSLNSVKANAEASNKNSGFCSSDGWLLSVPLFHIAGIGIIFRALTASARVVLPKNLSTAEIASSLEQSAATFISLVPTQFNDLFKLRGHGSLSKDLRVLMLGGGFIPETLLREAAKSHSVMTTYGMTESNSHICATPPTKDLELLLSSGRPLPGSSLKILDTTGCECAAMVEGEIAISGESLFSGYLSEEGEVIARDMQLFRTGDLGYLRKDGSLVVSGRIGRVIKSGGEKIQLEEIEQSAARISGIAECAVVGRQDERWGERPVLFVVPEHRSTLSAEVIRKELLTLLPKFKIPEDIYLLNALPRTGSGKVDFLSLSRARALSQPAL